MSPKGDILLEPLFEPPTELILHSRARDRIPLARLRDESVGPADVPVDWRIRPCTERFFSIFRLAGASHCRQLELGHQQGTEQIGFVGTNPSFGEIGKENPLMIHCGFEIHPVANLSENVAANRA